MRMALFKEVEADTTAIIKGWQRTNKDDCFAYVCEPDHDFDRNRNRIKPPKHKLFLAYILPSGEIDAWGWRPKDIDNPLLPIGLTGEVIWPLNL